MTRGDLVAAEAYEWLGTPFVWQASAKGAGCDCKGLVWGVARELGFPEADGLTIAVADYAPNRPVDSAFLKAGLAEIFDAVTDMEAGDILLLKVKGKPSHLAIHVGNGRAIHAQIGAKSWVKETRLEALLKAFPVDSIWRWR